MERRRGWVGWLAANRLVTGILAVSLVVAITAIVVAVNRSDDGTTPVAIGTQPSVDDPATADTPTGVATAPGRRTPGAVGTQAPGTQVRPGATSAPGTKLAPGTKAPVTAKCTPRQPRAANGQPETGITDDSITIGQIVSDSSNLPAQLRPNYEGLSAYVRKVNRAGGVCGRQIKIQYDNDNSFPATHRYEQMAQSVFSFVANSTLLDSQDYNGSPPFNPRYKDNRTGEYVPDVGGLAYSYNRSQSLWHAGVIGSISPVLVGGGAFRAFLDMTKREGRPCRKVGIVYLVEPTGASEDQARLGQIAFESDWGGNLGPGGTKLYQASLAAPVTVYRGIVQSMIRDGMNCAGTYADLGSNVSLVVAAAQEGVWPPEKCTRAIKSECFNLIYMPFSGYDPKFIRDVEAQAAGASRGVITFLPHVPLNETSDPALSRFLADLAECTRDSAYPQCKDAEPSTFSIIGYASGIMFVDALRACGAAPTRLCVMTYLRGLRNFTGNGVIGPVTPFACLNARDDYPGSRNYGTYCWKGIFTNSVTVRVEGTEKDLIKRFHRVRPASGFAPDKLRVARGTPA